MAQPGGRPGVYEAISIVALLFMVIGIAIAVMQWMAYTDDPAPIPRGIDPPSKLRPSIEPAETDSDEADADGGAEAPAPDDAKKPDKDGAEAPAKGGEEDIEF